MKRIRYIILNGAILLLAILACLGFAIYKLDSLFYRSPEQRATLVSARATESALTLAYGTEARNAIQTFIDRNWSLDTFRNPNLLSEVATGQYLRDRQDLYYKLTSGTVDVIRSALIKKVQLIGYDSTQFKAFSCETLNFDEVTIDGAFVSSGNPLTAYRLYVFKRENGLWKVAALADFTDADHIYRDWTTGSYSHGKKI